MKTILPKRPVQPRKTSPRIATFAKKQTSDLQSKYQKAVDKRQKLARARGAAEAQSDGNLVGTYEVMEQQTERSIDRLQDEMKLAGIDATKIE